MISRLNTMIADEIKYGNVRALTLLPLPVSKTSIWLGILKNINKPISKVVTDEIFLLSTLSEPVIRMPSPAFGNLTMQATAAHVV